MCFITVIFAKCLPNPRNSFILYFFLIPSCSSLPWTRTFTFWTSQLNILPYCHRSLPGWESTTDLLGTFRWHDFSSWHSSWLCRQSPAFCLSFRVSEEIILLVDLLFRVYEKDAFLPQYAFPSADKEIFFFLTVFSLICICSQQQWKVNVFLWLLMNVSIISFFPFEYQDSLMLYYVIILPACQSFLGISITVWPVILIILHFHSPCHRLHLHLYLSKYAVVQLLIL